MKIEILRSALQDLVDGYHFYEKQKASLGSLYSNIDSLTINAGVHINVFKHYYRLLSKQFPFAIYYKIGHKKYAFTPRLTAEVGAQDTHKFIFLSSHFLQIYMGIH